MNEDRKRYFEARVRNCINNPEDFECSQCGRTNCNCCCVYAIVGYYERCNCDSFLPEYYEETEEERIEQEAYHKERQERVKARKNESLPAGYENNPWYHYLKEDDEDDEDDEEVEEVEEVEDVCFCEKCTA